MSQLYEREEAREDDVSESQMVPPEREKAKSAQIEMQPHRAEEPNSHREGCCTYLEYAKAYLEQTEVKLLRKELVAGEAQRRCSTRVSEMSRRGDAKNKRCQRKELSTEEILTETERYFITNK